MPNSFQVTFSKTSYSIFKHRYQSKWQACLPFRSKSQFAECNDCFTMKQQIREEKDWAELLFGILCKGFTNNPLSSNFPEDLVKKFALIKDYKDHLQAVSLDRELEQFLESQDPMSAKEPTLFIQVDGVDQSKWSLPRIVQHRGSKDVQKYIRPRLKVVGCWCSGYLLSLYLVDANFSHDASLTCEVPCLQTSNLPLAWYLNSENQTIPFRLRF